MMETTKCFMDEATGISYNLVGDHYLPDFKVIDHDNQNVGRFGRERLDYLKDNRKLMYINLLTSGNLYSHLHEIEETAYDRIELISKQIAKTENVTEKLKAEDMMRWVQKMNNICNRVTEIIRDELIYT